MESEICSAGDPRRIDSNIAGILQRFRVDDLENFANRAQEAEIYRLPFDRRAEVGDVERSASDAYGLNRSACGIKIELSARKSRCAVDLPHRRQPIQVIDGQTSVTHRALRRDHFGRTRDRI